MKCIQRIGILGHYGNRNLGDEAIIQAVVQNFKARLPNVDLVGFSINPEDTRLRYGIEAYPIRYRLGDKHSFVHGNDHVLHSSVSTSFDSLTWKERFKRRLKHFPALYRAGRFCHNMLSNWKILYNEVCFLFRSYRHLKTVDVLLVTGSNQFLDNFGGPWGFPYTLLKWSLLAKISGTQLFFVSIGAGPLSHTLSYRFIRWALRFSVYVSLRDLSSQRMLYNLVGYKLKTYVTPDLAHSLSVRDIKPVVLPDINGTHTLPVVGINPMPLFDPRYWCEADDYKYCQYINKITDFSQKLIESSYPVYFFPTQEKDLNVISDILDLLQERGVLRASREAYVLPSNTVNELLANISACDITVPTRFHGTVLSLLLEKPLLGICYYQKAKDLLASCGQGQYSFDHESFKVEDLWDSFQSLTREIDKAKALIRNKNTEHVSALKSQYRDIIALMNSTDR